MAEQKKAAGRTHPKPDSPTNEPPRPEPELRGLLGFLDPGRDCNSLGKDTVRLYLTPERDSYYLDIPGDEIGDCNEIEKGSGETPPWVVVWVLRKADVKFGKLTRSAAQAKFLEGPIGSWKVDDPKFFEALAPVGWAITAATPTPRCCGTGMLRTCIGVEAEGVEEKEKGLPTPRCFG